MPDPDALPALALPPILLDAPGWLVIDKPAGLAVHPGPRTPRSLEDLLPDYAPNRPVPQPVHRLDRDTSGCLLLARRRPALRALAAQFEAGRVGKLYWAIVRNPPAGREGQVAQALEKVSSAQEGWRMVPSARGKPAVTDWEVLERAGALALMAFRPRNGRTHQIRVHATCLGPGTAIVGDPVYGEPDARGLMLHARGLRFSDPATGTDVIAGSPSPARFAALGFGQAEAAVSF